MREEDRKQRQHTFDTVSAASGAKRLQEGHGQLLVSIDAVLLPEPKHGQKVQLQNSAASYQSRKLGRGMGSAASGASSTAIGSRSKANGSWVNGKWKANGEYVSVVSGTSRGRTGRLRYKVQALADSAEYDVALADIQSSDQRNYQRISGAKLRLGAVELLSSSITIPQSPDPFSYKVAGAWLATPRITPAVKDAWIEVMMLGLRDLQPRNLVPLMRPFVSFSQSGEPFAFEERQTKPSNRPSATDPNFEDKPLLIKARLPLDPIFMPQLHVKVHDTMLGMKRAVLAQGAIVLPLELEEEARGTAKGSTGRGTVHHEDDHVECIYEYHLFRIRGVPTGYNPQIPTTFYTRMQQFYPQFDTFLKDPKDRSSGPKADTQAWEWVDQVGDGEGVPVIIQFGRHRGKRGTMQSSQLAYFDEGSFYDVVLDTNLVDAKEEKEEEEDEEEEEEEDDDDEEEEEKRMDSRMGLASPSFAPDSALEPPRKPGKTVRAKGRWLGFERPRFYGWQGDGEGWSYASACKLTDAQQTCHWSKKKNYFHHVRRRRWTRRRARKSNFEHVAFLDPDAARAKLVEAARRMVARTEWARMNLKQAAFMQWRKVSHPKESKEEKGRSMADMMCRATLREPPSRAVRNPLHEGGGKGSKGGKGGKGSKGGKGGKGSKGGNGGGKSGKRGGKSGRQAPLSDQPKSKARQRWHDALGAVELTTVQPTAVSDSPMSPTDAFPLPIISNEAGGFAASVRMVQRANQSFSSMGDSSDKGRQLGQEEAQQSEDDEDKNAASKATASDEEYRAGLLVEKLIRRNATAEPYRFVSGGALRRVLKDDQRGGGELERTFRSAAYQTVVLYRGEQSKNKRLNRFRSVGLLKCRVRVLRSADGPTALGSGGSGDGSTITGRGGSPNSVFEKQDVVVRLYVLEAHRVQMDQSWAKHHPYLRVSLEGERAQSTREKHLTLRHHENASALPFFQLFSVGTTLPGPSQLNVQLMDFHTVNSDMTSVLVGQTVIDLEERWFNQQWHEEQYILPPHGSIKHSDHEAMAHSSGDPAHAASTSIVTYQQLESLFVLRAAKAIRGGSHESSRNGTHRPGLRGGIGTGQAKGRPDIRGRMGRNMRGCGRGVGVARLNKHFDASKFNGGWESTDIDGEGSPGFLRIKCPIRPKNHDGTRSTQIRPLVQVLDFAGGVVSAESVVALKVMKERAGGEISFVANECTWVADETLSDLDGELHFRRRRRGRQGTNETENQKNSDDDDDDEEEDEDEEEEEGEGDAMIVWTRVSSSSESVLDKFTLEDLLHFMETHGPASSRPVKEKILDLAVMSMVVLELARIDVGARLNRKVWQHKWRCDGGECGDRVRGVQSLLVRTLAGGEKNNGEQASIQLCVHHTSRQKRRSGPKKNERQNALWDEAVRAQRVDARAKGRRVGGDEGVAAERVQEGNKCMADSLSQQLMTLVEPAFEQLLMTIVHNSDEASLDGSRASEIRYTKTQTQRFKYRVDGAVRRIVDEGHTVATCILPPEVPLGSVSISAPGPDDSPGCIHRNGHTSVLGVYSPRGVEEVGLHTRAAYYEQTQRYSSSETNYLYFVPLKRDSRGTTPRGSRRSSSEGSWGSMRSAHMHAVEGHWCVGRERPAYAKTPKWALRAKGRHNNPANIDNSTWHCFQPDEAAKSTRSRPGSRSSLRKGFRAVGVKANNVTIKVYDQDDSGASRQIQMEQGVAEIQGQICKLVRACLFSLRYGVSAQPIELRPLRDPKSYYHHDKGALKLWLEILTPDEAELLDLSNMAPPADHSGELRVIVWKAKRLPSKDTEGKLLEWVPGQGDGGVNDPYVKVWMESHEGPPQTTDTHLRSKKGRAEWNYRMLFPVDLRQRSNKNRLHLQIWDYDVFKYDDLIGETVIDLDPAPDDGVNGYSFFSDARKQQRVVAALDDELTAVRGAVKEKTSLGSAAGVWFKQFGNAVNVNTTKAIMKYGGRLFKNSGSHPGALDSTGAASASNQRPPARTGDAHVLSPFLVQEIGQAGFASSNDRNDFLKWYEAKLDEKRAMNNACVQPNLGRFSHDPQLRVDKQKWMTDMKEVGAVDLAEVMQRKWDLVQSGHAQDAVDDDPDILQRLFTAEDETRKAGSCSCCGKPVDADSSGIGMDEGSCGSCSGCRARSTWSWLTNRRAREHRHQLVASYPDDMPDRDLHAPTKYHSNWSTLERCRDACECIAWHMLNFVFALTWNCCAGCLRCLSVCCNSCTDLMEWRRTYRQRREERCAVVIMWADGEEEANFRLTDHVRLYIGEHGEICRKYSDHGKPYAVVKLARFDGRKVRIPQANCVRTSRCTKSYPKFWVQIPEAGFPEEGGGTVVGLAAGAAAGLAMGGPVGLVGGAAIAATGVFAGKAHDKAQRQKKQKKYMYLQVSACTTTTATATCSSR
jgi:hypothetical protein